MKNKDNYKQYLLGIYDNDEEYVQYIIDKIEKANNDDVESQLWLASYYFDGGDFLGGEDDLKIECIDFKKCYEYYLSAAKNNSLRGCIEVGICYFKGIGIKIDYSKAEKWFNKVLNNKFRENSWENAPIEINENDQLLSDSLKEYKASVDKLSKTFNDHPSPYKELEWDVSFESEAKFYLILIYLNGGKAFHKKQKLIDPYLTSIIKLYKGMAITYLPYPTAFLNFFGDIIFTGSLGITKDINFAYWLWQCSAIVSDPGGEIRCSYIELCGLINKKDHRGIQSEGWNEDGSIPNDDFWKNREDFSLSTLQWAIFETTSTPDPKNIMMAKAVYMKLLKNTIANNTEEFDSDHLNMNYLVDKINECSALMKKFDNLENNFQVKEKILEPIANINDKGYLDYLYDNDDSIKDEDNIIQFPHSNISNNKNISIKEVEKELKNLSKKVDKLEKELSNKNRKAKSSYMSEDLQENDILEFKSSLRLPYPEFPKKLINKNNEIVYKINNKEFPSIKSLCKFIETQCLKTIVAFLNTNGGKLVIGINEKDNKKLLVGIEKDLEGQKSINSLDAYERHLSQIIQDRIGSIYLGEYISIRFEKERGKTLSIVTVKKYSKADVVMLDGVSVYKRNGARTDEIIGRELIDFTKNKLA